MPSVTVASAIVSRISANGAGVPISDSSVPCQRWACSALPAFITASDHAPIRLAPMVTLNSASGRPPARNMKNATLAKTSGQSVALSTSNQLRDAARKWKT